MKFGVREICDVVLKKKARGPFGKLIFEAGMPVIYFDTLKTSSLEGTTTTVYAQGGKGNPRLVAWEGDKTVTFTMEDALISPESFSILSGAGFIDSSDESPICVHTTEQIEVKDQSITLSKVPSDKGEMYIMLMTSDGSIDISTLPKKVVVPNKTMALTEIFGEGTESDSEETDLYPDGTVFYVDYYVEAGTNSKVKQINIEASKFGGSYYLEASTLWRDQATGEDYPAEFIIPNCKVQSNFTFTMASTGDPSTFTFTMDAFPDYTKFDKTKKVIAAIQIVEDQLAFKSDNP